MTKLSLVLKILENENAESAGTLLSYSAEKMLPDLSNNIKCGNSLIGSDFYKDKQMDMFDAAEMRKVNAFDWEKEFPSVFGKEKEFHADSADKKEDHLRNPRNLREPGFDVMIGNPPYFNIQTLGAKSPEAEYIMRKYSSVWMDKSDILFYFVAKAIQLCRGQVSFIISNAFLFADKAKNLRNYIIENASITEIINFEQYQVFANASITTAILKLDKEEKHEKTKTRIFKEKNYDEHTVLELLHSQQNYIWANLKKDNVFALIDGRIDDLNQRIDGVHKSLGEILFVGKGMETAANEVFQFSEFPNKFPDVYIKKRMSGEIIERYFFGKEIEYILYFENIEIFEDLPKSIQNHLLEHKSILKERATVKNEGRAWWRYSRPMHKELYIHPKIWCSYRAKRNEFVLDETGEYIGLTNTVAVFGTNKNISLKYILGLLNSKLLNYRHKTFAKQTGNGVFEYVPNVIEKFPIPNISLEEQAIFIDIVNQMLTAQNEFHAAKESDKAMLKQKIDAIDAQIDALVYELYGLTEEEIKVVEGKA